MAILLELKSFFSRHLFTDLFPKDIPSLVRINLELLCTENISMLSFTRRYQMLIFLHLFANLFCHIRLVLSV